MLKIKFEWGVFKLKNLPTLQELFNHNIFKVPDYQRGYSWENRHRKTY